MHASTRSQRPLLGVWSALGLIVATGAAFAALFPMSREREARAFASAPDMLALSYLNLALSRTPNDAALRSRVAERTLAAGQFDRARAVLAPLLGSAAAPGVAALQVDIDYRAWAAVDPKDARLRSIALARLIATIERQDPEQLSLDDAERIARVCAQVGLIATRAVLLERVARADLGSDERLRAADAAQLELNDPLGSAELRAERALRFPERNGVVHAALALRRALAAGQPGAALVLYRKLRPSYGHHPRILELGLSALAGVDDVEALAVARELLASRPDDSALRQRVAQLSAWTEGEPATGATALAPPAVPPAPVRWDGGDAPAVDGTAPESSARAIERAALLESLGAPERALELLNAALAQKLVDERAIWDLKIGVQLRLGHEREALTTLEQMDARFGASGESVRRRAELLLSLGELSGALELLATAPGPRDVSDERRVTAIGWELGDMARVRAAYRVIVRSTEATPSDVRRLWLLERDAGEHAAGARTALAGFERFGEKDFLKLALLTAVAAEDDALVARVLAAGEKQGAGLSEDMESLRLLVSVRQGRASRALLDARPAQARAELGQSERLLDEARRAQPELGPGLGELWKAQDRQNLDLALADGDHALLARVYPKQVESLSARERVFVLHRLGRDEEAVGEALSGIESGALPEADSGALAADAEALARDMPREFGVLGDVLSTPGLTAVRVGAVARLSSGGRRLGARAELTRLGTGDALSLYLPGQDELAAELSGGLAESVLGVGVTLLDGRDPRPSLRFEQGLFDAGGLDVDLGARVNERSGDSPELRVIGVEDELSARATLAFLGNYSATLRGSVKLYSERIDRDVLGGAATLDAAIGRHVALPAGFGAHLRAAGYVAPRFEGDAAGPVPEGATWLGFGAGLTRGQLSVAPIAGRRLSVLADATAGWLLSLDELGWSGRLGLGISVLGADQFSILASASNVVSQVPGFAVYTLGADYKVSNW